MTVRRMRFACRITKATNTHSEHTIVIVFAQEQWLREHVSKLLLYNSNKSPTRCNSFPVYYPDVYLHLNMFRAFFRPSSGAR